MRSAPQIRSSVLAESFLPLARKQFPTCVTFASYIASLNSHLPNSPQIDLHRPELISESSYPAYQRLLSRLIVDFTDEAIPRFPRNATDSLHLSSAVSIDRLLAEAISITLSRHSSPFIASQKNVLCTGFAPAKQDGPGSPFPNLDARSSSAPIQVLRTPPWKLLLRHVGHTVLFHLFMHGTLLLCVEEGDPLHGISTTHSPEPSIPALRASVFLQLCGSITRRNSATQSLLRPPRSSATVNIQQDVLYRTPNRHCNVGIVTHNPGFPQSHHLHLLPKSPKAANILQQIIFLRQDTSKSTKAPARDYDQLASRLVSTSNAAIRGKPWLSIRKSLPKRLGRIIPILRQVVTRSRSYSLRRLLSLLAPLPNLPKEGSIYTPSKRDLLTLHTSPKLVARFLISSLNHLLPASLFGPLAHRHLLQRAVHSLIRSRGQRDSFDIRRFFLSQGCLALSEVPWLWRHTAEGRRDEEGKSVCNPSDLRFRQDRMLDLLIWIFRGLLIPILQQSFFVTEGTVHRKRVLFFRREIWSRVVDKMTSENLRANSSFASLSRKDLFVCTTQRRLAVNKLGWKYCPDSVFLYHNIRYIPKKSSMRGIQRPRGKVLVEKISKNAMGFRRNQPKSRALVLNGLRSMRLLMRNIHAVLRAETQAQPALLGASVFSLDEIYRKYLRFVRRWQEDGKPKQYFCCFDIENSFDTIPLKALFHDVVPKVLARNRYPIVKYSICKHEIFSSKLRLKFKAHVCIDAGEETHFLRLLRQKLASGQSGSVVTDLANTTTLDRNIILDALNEFLMNNIISVPRRYRKNRETAFAVQAQGLPQGHPLSSLLTSIFYGSIERQDLDVFLPQQPDSVTVATSSETNGTSSSLFMRLVDDTVFITSDRKKAFLFIERMIAGWKFSHGFSTNKEKTRTSFPVGLGGAENLRFIPWCGLLFDSETLEVRGDYERYASAGTRLRDSLSIEQDWQPGRLFLERAASCFRPKLHPILLDAQINSSTTVALNVYQAALLTCLKMCAYARVLSVRNEAFFEELVDMVVTNFARTVNWSATKRTATLLKCRMPVSRVEVRYLVAHAFSTALARRLDIKSLSASAQKCINKLHTAMRQLAPSLRQKNRPDFERAVKGFSATACKSLWSLHL